MGRNNDLKRLSPEDRAEYDRMMVNERKRRQRRKENELNTAKMTPDLEAFVDELVSLDLRTAAMALAMWQREYKQPFPAWVRPAWQPGMSQQELDQKDARWRRFQLVRLFAANAFDTYNARGRKRRFDRNELDEAEARGVSLPTLREAKRKMRVREVKATKLAKVNAVRRSPGFGKAA